MNFSDNDCDLSDTALIDFANYNDYLDAQMNDDALYYLDDPDLARQMIQLGSVYGSGEILGEKEFY